MGRSSRWKNVLFVKRKDLSFLDFPSNLSVVIKRALQTEKASFFFYYYFILFSVIDLFDNEKKWIKKKNNSLKEN
jgi:hypothetical protein